MKRLQLGGELEAENLPIKSSTLEARGIFFELILRMKPGVVFNLLRFYNKEDLPLKWQPPEITLWEKFFLLRLSNESFRTKDFTRFDIKPSVSNTPF